MTAPVVVHVREAAAFETLLALLVEYERSLPERLRHGSEPDLESIQRTYADPNAAFIASVDGAAAGCIVLTRLDERTAVVQRLYVRPEYRRHGAARLLVSYAIDFARARNNRSVVLDTDRDALPEAFRLYASLGFTTCEPHYAVDYDNATFMELRF
jgi:ribosomal protein S18 acetylase RimI-like enzyme